MELLEVALYCAVDRESIGTRTGRAYYALTVNACTRDVVMLAFCLNHYKEYAEMVKVVTQEGWR